MDARTPGPRAGDADAPGPLYRRIKDDIRDAVDRGGLAPGDRVASEHELVRRYGVSRMTANRALRELTAEGLLTRVAGVGTFVADRRRQAELLEVRNIADEIRDRGGRHEARLVSAGAAKAGAAVARALGVAPGARVFRTVIVHLEDGTPVQLEDRWVDPSVAPDYLSADFSRTTPNEYLTRIAPIDEAEHVVEAVLPDADAQRLLGVGPAEPCLRLFRRTFSGGRVVTCAWLVHPGRLYRMSARFAQGRRPG
jgi:GntR family histidine utilization transcriptional repressor